MSSTVVESQMQYTHVHITQGEYWLSVGGKISREILRREMMYRSQAKAIEWEVANPASHGMWLSESVSYLCEALHVFSSRDSMLK